MQNSLIDTNICKTVLIDIEVGINIIKNGQIDINLFKNTHIYINILQIALFNIDKDIFKISNINIFIASNIFKMTLKNADISTIDIDISS